MKNLIHKLLAFILLLAWPFTANALDVYGTARRYGYNHGSQPLGDVTFVMDNSQNLLKAQYGVGLLLSPTQWTMWEREVKTLQISGNAVTRGKIAAEVLLTYSNDLKIARWPILADFAVGDEMIISGLYVRVYNRASGPQPLTVDVTGDNIKDYDSLMTIKIDETDVRTDSTPTYPPEKPEAAIDTNPLGVDLKWVTPLDYDFNVFEIEKSVGGVVTLIAAGLGAPRYTDTTVTLGENVTYSIYAKDKRGNRSVPATVSIVVTTAPAEQPPADSPTISAPLVGVPDNAEDETTLLNRLFSYYKVRYQIKCRNADSACLWAKIDLIYAQNRLNRTDVSISLSERERYLISLRLPFSQDRYQNFCVSAVNPAPYCTNLKRAIDRANNLLNP